MQQAKAKAKLNAEFESESEIEWWIIVDSHFYKLQYIIMHSYQFNHGVYPLLSTTYPQYYPL
jgi:hypothetical protein